MDQTGGQISSKYGSYHDVWISSKRLSEKESKL
jgi:hypothetical protein